LNNEAYEDAIRDLGIGAESLVSLLSEDLYTKNDIPNHMGGKLDRITNIEGGQPAFIAKTITPLWWLRNQVSHPNDYYPTEKEALFALQCFELAAETLIID